VKQAISLAFMLLIAAPSVGQMNEWYKTPPARQAHALQLQRDFEALNAQIPTLSPSEEQWLKREIDDTIAGNGGRYTKRALDAMQSRAWSIRVAKPHAQLIIADLGSLATQRDRMRETRQWARIAALLMDHDFWQAVEDLQQRGVIDKQYLRFLGDFPGLTAGVWAQQILNEVVVPYFDAPL
jgi:hypothetical protein